MSKIGYFFLILTLCLIPLPALAGENSQSLRPFAELLYWRAAETNASWATTINFPPKTVDVVQSTPKFDTHAGVRAGISYSPGDHFWDSKFYYTYYTTSASDSIGLGTQIVSSLFFSGSYFISEDLYFGGSSSWDLTMHSADFEISHALHPTPGLTLSPKIGIKAASINQSISISWNAVAYKSTENLNNNFSGAGPSFGLNAKWSLINNFSLVGDISTALMYGQWNDTDVYRRPASLVTTQTTISNSANNSKLGTSMVSSYLGLEWHHHGRSDVTVQFGYEGQYWLNQLRLLAIQQLRTYGDLTFQGATCNVTINF